MGEHEGHRERLRSKYLCSGGEDLTDGELLELTLFYSVPRRDVRPLAENLLARFGSLSGVFDASAGELCEIAGIGEHSALLLGTIGALRDLVRRPPEVAHTPDRVRDILLPRLRGIDRDHFFALYLGSDRSVRARKSLSPVQDPDPAGLCRIIANQARLLGTPAVILARGFARACAIPDRELSLALALDRGLTAVGVTLRDYVVVTPVEYLSMAGRLFGRHPPYPIGGDREAES